jgi:hypothetical protein
MSTEYLPRLTEEEEVTLRRVAYGQSEVRALRRHDLDRLHALRLIEHSKDGPRLTPRGKERFDVLPKAGSLGDSTRYEEMLTAMGRQAPIRKR